MEVPEPGQLRWRRPTCNREQVHRCEGACRLRCGDGTGDGGTHIDGEIETPIRSIFSSS
jgi:hypothetical protein